MSYPLQVDEMHIATVTRLDDEISHARKKFPKNRRLLAALMEEIGEVARAYLQGNYDEARAECLQVACVAIRILEEGDADFEETERDPAEMLK